MKHSIFAIIFGVIFIHTLPSCKKTYSCECNGHSTQKIEFTEYKTVKAVNSKKADEECIELGAYYDISNYSSSNVQFVNCNYKP